MYEYPINDDCLFSNLIRISSKDHSMGDSLKQYLDIKIHPFIEKKDIHQVIIRGHFDRSNGISVKEKNGKLFNYMRPTAEKIDQNVIINCFPGIDYVYHYGNIISSYFKQKGVDTITVEHIIPTENLCWQQIVEELESIPITQTVIMGYVEGLQWMSNDIQWHGTGYFLWKKVKLSSGEGLLLGCKHTYWGEISGRIVLVLANKGIKRIIYSGKLGTLNHSLIPNKSIATGNTTILPNGQTISWTNLFENISSPQVFHGKHITIPSVLQETTEWVRKNKDMIDFVDPEIGHMALAAYRANIAFSYIHIISDNLSKKYSFNLSNERIAQVIADRSNLLKTIGNEIIKL